VTILNDKKGFIDRIISEPGKYTLNLGCGRINTLYGSIGVDIIDSHAVDIVGDVYEVLEKLPDSSVLAIYSSHFVEHLDDFTYFLEVVSRVLKPSGDLIIVAPHFSNPYFYSDVTHRSTFGLYTCCYYCLSSPLRRKVPTYNRDLKFRLDKVDLIFKSTRPNYGRHAIKKVFGSLFNSTIYMREFWEENLCYIFPCYEVKYVLKKI
jgi:hypothetical protein